MVLFDIASPKRYILRAPILFQLTFNACILGHAASAIHNALHPLLFILHLLISRFVIFDFVFLIALANNGKKALPIPVFPKFKVVNPSFNLNPRDNATAVLWPNLFFDKFNDLKRAVFVVTSPIAAPPVSSISHPQTDNISILQVLCFKPSANAVAPADPKRYSVISVFASFCKLCMIVFFGNKYNVPHALLYFLTHDASFSIGCNIGDNFCFLGLIITFGGEDISTISPDAIAFASSSIDANNPPIIPPSGLSFFCSLFLDDLLLLFILILICILPLLPPPSSDESSELSSSSSFAPNKSSESSPPSSISESLLSFFTCCFFFLPFLSFLSSFFLKRDNKPKSNIGSLIVFFNKNNISLLLNELPTIACIILSSKICISFTLLFRSRYNSHKSLNDSIENILHRCLA